MLNTVLWSIAVLLALIIVAAAIIRRRASRIALRALHRSRSRVDRFKLTKKSLVRETLLADEAVGQAVREHSAENSIPESLTWKRVETYIDEIVPFFNILTYYRIGLVDYVLGVARDPEMRKRLYIVPVAINYDRVLEDRSLLRELDAREGRTRPPRRAQLMEVLRYVWWNTARLVARKWKRYGRAAVVIGEPFAVA